MLQEWVAYQDKLRRWTRAQKQLAGANPSHDADAEDSDDKPPPDVQSRPCPPVLRDYTRLEKRWKTLLVKRSFKDHGRLRLDDELHMRAPKQVIAVYRKLNLNETKKLAEPTSDGGLDYRVEAEEDAVVDEAGDSNAGEEVDNAKDEEVARASKG